MKHWSPPIACTEREERLLTRIGKSRKLFAFFRLHRHELFDSALQSELEAMYRDSGQGVEAQPPALLCMALLVQGYLQVSDAEAVTLSGTDRRWRLVLGVPLDDDEPVFSQGGLQQFRERLIRHQMDRRLLECTILLAKRTKDFDWKKLPKDLRVAVDSRPFEGAGRVEDTFNLLGHAGKKIAQCMAKVLETTPEEICQQAGAPLLVGSSIKAELDIDWGSAQQKSKALDRLCTQLDRLSTWVEKRRPEEPKEAPLTRYIEALAQVKAQDLEPAGDGGVQIRQGVAEDRRISIEDPDMTHGRKSKSKKFNGYKQHISEDLDSELILAVAVTSANRPEEEATPELQANMARQGFEPEELQIDRAYVNSSLVEEVKDRDGEILSKPWRGANGTPGLFGKRDFQINIKEGTITCPAGEVETFEPGETVQFDPEACGPCALRAECTKAATGRGRTVTMGDDERLQKKLRLLQGTRAGRERLRDRVGVEHALAHLAARQGPRARYRGLRKNTYDLHRMAVLQNLETIQRRTSPQEKRAA